MAPLHRALLIGTLAGLAVRAHPGAPAAAKKVALRKRRDGSIRFEDHRSAERGARRRGEISARQQRKGRKILRAVQRGVPSYAGHPIRVVMDIGKVASTAIAVYAAPDGTYIVDYEQVQP